MAELMVSGGVQEYQHEKFGKMRVVMQDGEPWFVGRDIAEALGYIRPRNALLTHVPAKYKKDALIQGTLGGTQTMTIINEAGMYKLMFASRMPLAEEFSEWVCEEVLVKIRKQGYYVTDKKAQEIMSDPDKFIEMLYEGYKRVRGERDTALAELETAQAKIASLAPAAAKYERLLGNGEAITITEIAKEYGTNGATMNALLYKLKIQYPVSGRWVLYRQYMNKGYTVQKYSEVCGKVYSYMAWTERGKDFLYDALRAINVLPIMERDGMFKGGN